MSAITSESRDGGRELEIWVFGLSKVIYKVQLIIIDSVEYIVNDFINPLNKDSAILIIELKGSNKTIFFVQGPNETKKIRSTRACRDVFCLLKTRKCDDL